MKVEVADSIRSKPEVFAAVQLANGHLEELASSSSPNLRVDWRLLPPDERLVQLRLMFEDGDTHVGIAPIFPLTNLLDPVNCKLRMLRAWDLILEARSKRNREKIHELINQLERGELDGGEVTD